MMSARRIRIWAAAVTRYSSSSFHGGGGRHKPHRLPPGRNESRCIARRTVGRENQIGPTDQAVNHRESLGPPSHCQRPRIASSSLVGRLFNRPRTWTMNRWLL